MNSRQRILAVDDNPINLAIVEESLQDYDLKTAESGEEALEMLPSYCPDLVLLDIMMPGISGYEVCRQIRANEQLWGTKVIMVTAKAMTEERLQGYQVGADDYVTKPFDEGELLAKVKVYMRLRSIEEVDRLKSSMLMLLNSEFRAPLSGMISAADMIFQDDTITREERKAMAVHVANTGRKLFTLFSKLTKLGALKSGQHVLQRVNANLCDVLRSAICEVRSRTSRSDVQIKEQISECPTVSLDNEETKRVLVVIMENALEASPANAQVVVRVEREGATARLSVSDRGPGIDRDVLRQLFSDFTCCPKTHREGRGLDLAIAYELMKQQGGAISVETSSESGTTFALEWPLCSSVPGKEENVSVGRSRETV